jgi:penicillin amidase
MDRAMRRKGMVFGAEKAEEAIRQNPETEAILEAYAAGVNEWINHLEPAQLPIEYKLLHYQPEPWTLFKTCLLSKYMAHNLSFRGSEIQHTRALQRWGEDVFELLYPEFPYLDDPIVPAETQFNSRIALPQPPAPQDYRPDSLLISFQLADPHRDLGSNNWAVAGKRSATGRPLLANDPHLGLNLPAIWYEAQLSTPDMNVYGVSLPGSPGIVIGFNDSIAWGVTNAGVDVIDYYRIDFQNEKKESYRHDGKWLQTRRKIESFQIKGGETRYDTVYYTHHGPVLYDENFGEAEFSLAIHWQAHEPSNEFLTYLNLMRAKNYADYEAAISLNSCPAQNYVFASASGDIAIWQMGRYPNRWDQQGRFLLDGSRKEHDWQSYIPWQQQPHQFNPYRGFVSSANQHPTSPLYPYYYNGGFATYRGRRINQLLAGRDTLTLRDMQEFQLDNYNVMAADVLPLLLSELDTTRLSSIQLRSYQALKSWDYNYGSQLVAPSIFEKWWSDLYSLIWGDEFSGPRGFLKNPSASTTAGLLRDSVRFSFYRTPADTSLDERGELVNRSFHSAVDTLASRYPEEEDWIWAKRKSTDIRHLSRQINSFSRLGLPTDGNGEILNATGRTHGPSWRMVVALGEEPEAYGIYPGGQSGNPGDPNYDAFIDDWVAGEYYQLWFMQDVRDRRHPVLTQITYR